MSSIYSRKLDSQKVDSAYLDAAFSVKETFSYFFLVTNDIIPLNVSENPRISTLLEAKPWKLFHFHCIHILLTYPCQGCEDITPNNCNACEVLLFTDTGKSLSIENGRYYCFKIAGSHHFQTSHPAHTHIFFLCIKICLIN